jgi:hypothetical protein
VWSVWVRDRPEDDYFGPGRLDWRDAIDEPGGIEFNLPISSGCDCSTKSALTC